MRIALKIFPKILALDLDVTSRVNENGKFNVVFLYSNEGNLAGEIVAIFRDRVPTIKGIEVIPIAVSIDDIPHHLKASAVFLVEPFLLRHLTKIKKANPNHHSLIFSPYEEDVEGGIHCGIYIGARVMPLLNVKSLRKAGIRFHEKFMQVAKKYE